MDRVTPPPVRRIAVGREARSDRGAGSAAARENEPLSATLAKIAHASRSGRRFRNDEFPAFLLLIGRTRAIWGSWSSRKPASHDPENRDDRTQTLGCARSKTPSSSWWMPPDAYSPSSYSPSSPPGGGVGSGEVAEMGAKLHPFDSR